MKKQIFIYQDEGSSLQSTEAIFHLFKDFLDDSYSILPIDHQTIIERRWMKSASLIAFPGGRDVPYDRALRGAGNNAIHEFVEGGGSYLGICAGAYYATSEVIFDKSNAQEVHETRELGFYPGASVGPLVPYKYNSEKGAIAALITLGNDSLRTYYNGGCYFANPEKYPDQVTVISRYLDFEEKAAIILCSVGKGKALLSGVHFEYPLAPNAKEMQAALIRDLLNE